MVKKDFEWPVATLHEYFSKPTYSPHTQLTLLTKTAEDIFLRKMHAKRHTQPSPFGTQSKQHREAELLRAYHRGHKVNDTEKTHEIAAVFRHGTCVNRIGMDELHFSQGGCYAEKREPCAPDTPVLNRTALEGEPSHCFSIAQYWGGEHFHFPVEALPRLVALLESSIPLQDALSPDDHGHDGDSQRAGFTPTVTVPCVHVTKANAFTRQWLDLVLGDEERSEPLLVLDGCLCTTVPIVVPLDTPHCGWAPTSRLRHMTQRIHARLARERAREELAAQKEASLDERATPEDAPPEGTLRGSRGRRRRHRVTADPESRELLDASSVRRRRAHLREHHVDPGSPSKLDVPAAVTVASTARARVAARGLPSILVVRRSNSRRVLNHDELMNVLYAAHPHHRVVVYDDQESISVLQLAQLFHQADLIVAPHGAGLVNMMACRRGTVVVEFTPFDGNPCFLNLAAQLGILYVGVGEYTLANNTFLVQPYHFLAVLTELAALYSAGRLGDEVHFHTNAANFRP